VRKKKTLDVFELKRRIETGKSLSSLKDDIQDALREGTISFESYQKTLRVLENTDANNEQNKDLWDIRQEKLPFSANALAQYLENKTL
jgi:predicted RNA-binding protein associated with RNAse of E/G family